MLDPYQLALHTLTLRQLASAEQLAEITGQPAADIEANPEKAAVAVVTEQGGATSHAAVVSRALDTPCVTGCGEGTVERLLGRTVTVDATTGRIYAGKVPTSAVDEAEDDDLRGLGEWAEQAVARVTVASTGSDVPAPVLEADDTPPAELGEGQPDIPPGTRTVRGALFTTPDGVRAAVDAGVDVIVAAHRLPVLLSVVAAQGGPS